MAYVLDLPGEWSEQGWKVKIRDDELLDRAHVSILRQRRSWRVSLETGTFLSGFHDPAEVPPELVAFVWSRRAALRDAWNSMYPESPVHSDGDPDAH